MRFLFLTRNQPMVLRVFSLAVIFFSSLLLFSCQSKEKKENQLIQKSEANKRAPIKADVFIAAAKQMVDNLEIAGTIVANQSTEIRSEVAGRITGIYFKEGAFVSKGTLLIKLYDADLQAQKQKLLVQIKVAEANRNRSEQLVKIGGISRQDYETTMLTTASAQSDLAVLETNIRKTEIRAPFSGKLGLRMVSTGTYVSPATVLTTISQMSQLRIDFTVPEVYISKISLGKLVSFKVEGNNRTYAAKVLATQSNITANTRTLQVRAMVQGNPPGLLPGNFATVSISFDPDPNAIMIPTQAIVPQARGKKVFVYQNGISKAVDVTTGLRDSANIQITSGLKAGDTVLITGLLSVKPDGRVMLGNVFNGTQPTVQKQTNASETKSK